MNTEPDTTADVTLDAPYLRREADEQLVKLIRSAGIGSESAEMFGNELRNIGLGTLINLHSQNLLFRRLEKMRIYLPMPPPPEYRAEARALFLIATCTAVPIFLKDYLFGGRWEPERASLRTCFVNACLITFAVEYRRYCAEERRDREVLGYENQFEPDVGQHYTPRPPLDPEAQAINRVEIERLLSASMSSGVRLMLVRTALGFSQKEIADELGLSENAVSSQLRRIRKRIADGWLPSAAAQEVTSPGTDHWSAMLRREVAAWGVTDADQISQLLLCIDGCREHFEDRRFTQLRRPVPGHTSNRLDFVLDGPDDVPTGSRKIWMENGARVTRHVVAEMKKVVPALERPRGSDLKNLQADLRKFYRALRILDNYMKTTLSASPVCDPSREHQPGVHQHIGTGDRWPVTARPRSAS